MLQPLAVSLGNALLRDRCALGAAVRKQSPSACAPPAQEGLCASLYPKPLPAFDSAYSMCLVFFFLLLNRRWHPSVGGDPFRFCALLDFVFSQGNPCTDCSHPVPSACLQLSAEHALGCCGCNLKAGFAFLQKKKKERAYGPCRCLGREARSKELSLQKALFPLDWKDVPLPSRSARKPALGLTALTNLIQELQGAYPDPTTPPGSAAAGAAAGSTTCMVGG